MIRISKLSMESFRAFKEPISFDFSEGFCIISGRNGTGKSSICDAIEFALTGSISRYKNRTENRETIKDYLRWRGGSNTQSCKVSLELTDENNESIKIDRTDNKLVSPNIEQINSWLIRKDIAPNDPIRELCESFIIRDEQISRLSLDLTAQKRFDFIEKVIGVVDFTKYEEKLVQALSYLESQLKTADKSYQNSRSVINRNTEKLSELQSEISKRGSVTEAETYLRDYFSIPRDSVNDVISFSTDWLVNRKKDIDIFINLEERLHDVYEILDVINSPKYKKDYSEVTLNLDKESSKSKVLESELEQLEAVINELKSQEPENYFLAQLQEAGSKIGLQEGMCPLCRLEQDESHFQKHLEELKDKISQRNSTLQGKIQSRDSKKTELNFLNIQIELLRTRSLELINKRKALENLNLVIINTSANINFEISDNELKNPKEILIKLNKFKEKLETDIPEVLKNVRLLEMNSIVGITITLENELKRDKNNSTQLSNKIDAINIAINKLDQARKQIRRATVEIVDERLAKITPLMEEMYTRIRPHNLWSFLDYKIRGDIRRFLSFSVGDEELNPAFMFSSGQSRALGLTFLLSLILSRTWSPLKVIVLDDPVQHIDDFRAVHLTEVLDAIRRAGYQIICTVEDEALANLLSRRMRSGEGDGLRVKMKFSAEKGAHIIEKHKLSPLAQNVLKSA